NGSSTYSRSCRAESSFASLEMSLESARNENGALNPSSPQSGGLARRVVAGVGWITVAGGIAPLFFLFFAPILTALVSPGEYGVVALVNTVVSLGATVALCGVDTAYGRYWAGGAEPEHDRVERFCWRLAIVGSFFVSAIAALVWWIFLARK